MSHYPPDAKWHEMEKGGVIPQPGNAAEYDVGGWRNERPVKDNETCIDCFFCWAYCPDNAIEIVEGKAGEGRTVIVKTLRCGFVYEAGGDEDPVVIRKAEVEIA